MRRQPAQMSLPWRECLIAKALRLRDQALGRTQVDAFARGYDTRIGLEDTLTLPDGRQAADNAALVRVAMDIVAAGSKKS